MVWGDMKTQHTHAGDPILLFNENSDMETMTVLKLKIKLLCLLKAILLVEKHHNSYLSYH